MNSESIKLKRNIDLAPLTTLKVGGKAKRIFFVKNRQSLSRLLRRLGGPFYILGNGSNLLIDDKTIERPVIKLSGEFDCIKEKPGMLEVGASTLLPFLVKYCVNHNLSGLESLAGIPATIGGMVKMNASSFGASIFDHLQEIELMNPEGKIYRKKKDKISYGYRHSGISQEIILKAYFAFSQKRGRIKEHISSIIKKRIVQQDFSFPSCGSVFKNPPGETAAVLIDRCGLKGRQKGGLRVSEKHANYMLNLGGGFYKDARDLIEAVKESVYKKYAVSLEEEVEIWN